MFWAQETAATVLGFGAGNYVLLGGRDCQEANFHLAGSVMFGYWDLVELAFV